MIGAPFWILFAAASPAETVPVSGSGEAPLGVTATVIRPVEISIQSISAKAAIVTLRYGGSVEVEAAGATVTRRDQDMILAASDGAGPVIITVIY